ncbi:restriction endonuclease subunit S [Methanobrevibacter sp.]|uniref:restriction endonuclease subunit S n=1 Tax=Methanobrevibacter sp. TaxID=66852 RepID=UPI003870C235
MKFDYEKLGNLIEISETKNKDLTVTNLVGVNINKEFMPSVANTVGTNLANYKIIKKDQFVYNNMQVARDRTIRIVRYADETPSIISPAYKIFQVIDKSLLNAEFLMLYFLRPEFDRLCWFYTDSSIRGSLDWAKFCNLKVPVPPMDIQEKIVNIYNFINERIHLKNNINKNLEGLAKAIYRYHFIDFKPYASDGLMKDSSLGLIPKNWSVQSIEDFVDDMKNGGTPKRGESDYWDKGTVPWLKTGEINNNIIIKSEEHITELGLKNSSAKLLPVNSIIMALYGKGTAARIGLLKLEATTNQACCAMICNDFNKTLFLYLFLLFHQKEIENLASGSVQQNLSKDLIGNLELIVPPMEIIENLPFKEIYDKITNNYFEIEYLTNLRDTLLPKLMSGEIDVGINSYLE